MNRLKQIIFLACLLYATFSLTYAQEALNPWQEGYLDIHHIHSGRGNATFCIFPDGTSLLIDAGDLDKARFEARYAPLKAAPAYPHDSVRSGKYIAQYIRRVLPSGIQPRLDYALITHFHADHYGNVRETTPMAKNGGFKLTGITEVGYELPIGTLLDRGHHFPTDLNAYYKDEPTFQNYLAFIRSQSQNQKFRHQALLAGANDQIRLLYKPDSYPAFSVRNIKSSNQIWSGRRSEATGLFPSDSSLVKGSFNENPLSLAVKISYGSFDYFTGGDNTGMRFPGFPTWFDVETPMAAVIGKVEAMALNHHGNRDATNENFVRALAPRVAVQQLWCSDQPGQEVFHRLVSPHIFSGPRDIFSTYMHEETKVTMGPWLTNGYQSTEGHILIRVEPGGMRFFVLILSEVRGNFFVKQVHGPYEAG